VRSFSIRSIVVMAEPAAEIGGMGRSRAGFFGHEAAPDTRDRVILGGRVERIDGRVLTLAGAAGPITVELFEGGALYRLERGTLAQITDGDRVAIEGAADAEARAVLVLPARH
jgi:hypothetical protein